MKEKTDKKWHWYWGRPYDDYTYTHIEDNVHIAGFWVFPITWIMAMLFPVQMGHVLGQIWHAMQAVQ